MNAIQISWITGLFVPSVLFLCLGLLLSSVFFRHEQNRPFDIRSEFPFELVDAENPKCRLGRIFILFWGLLDAATAFYLVASIQTHSALLSLSIVYAVSMVLRNVSLVFLFYVPAYRFKPHFLSFVCSCAFSGFAAAVATIICANLRTFAGVPAIGFAIGIGLLGVCVMLIMVNPKLANWAKLESEMDESGAIVEKRPKVFILAFSEWLILFISMFLSAISLVAFIVFDLI